MITKQSSDQIPEERPMVLVVDDVRSMRVVLSATVKSFGYRCIAVKDGLAAWQFVLDEQPDIIITDIEMPLGDGLELIHKVRTSRDPQVREIPIIVCSSLADSLRNRPLLCSADDFFDKPIDLRHFKSTLYSFIEE